MDIFKFHNPTAPMKMEQGEIINGLKSKMWVERYDREGEFTLVGYANSGLKDILPGGTYISHVDTDEIMQVENHEIKGSKTKESEIIITGRSIEAPILESRISEPPKSYPFSDGPYDYYQPSEEPHWQIVNFINGLIDPGHVWYANDGIPYITIYSWIPDGAVNPDRYIKHGVSGLTTVQELLKSEKFGIKVVRPGPLSRGTAVVPDENVVFMIHNGVNYSPGRALSYDMGEIENADYFWSIRPRKTQAVVVGRWVGVRVSTGETNENRKSMYIDASSIDQNQQVQPTGATLTQIQNGMIRKGQEALASQKDVNIVNVEISKDGTHLVYRKHYNVGDIIMVNGEYNTSASFRIGEYIETEDENGSGGYPTLVLP